MADPIILATIREQKNAGFGKVVERPAYGERVDVIKAEINNMFLQKIRAR